MKKNLLLSFFFLAFANNLSAQNPLVKQWDYRYGGTDADYFYSFRQTNDGGYILGGFSWSGISGDKTQASWGNYDYWIVKINSLGIKEWDKRFGGFDMDYLTSIELTTDGGYVIGGYSSSGISGDKTQPSWGGPDYWIVKIDSLGAKQWDKRFGGTADDYLYSLQQTTEGGYILGGYSKSGIGGDKTQSTWGSEDYWIVKIDSIGNKEWDKRFGGLNPDYLNVLRQTIDGGYILGGSSWSGMSGDKTQASWGNIDYWIIKVNPFGIKQWDKRFGATNTEGLFSMQQTTDHGFILGGYSNSGINGDKTQPNWGTIGNTSDFWIVKVDSIGNKQWDKRFGGTGNDDDFGSILQTFDGGYLLSGTSYSPVSGDKTESNLGIEQPWIIKTDSLGIKQFDKTIFTIGHEEYCFIVQTSDGCYAIANDSPAGIGGYKTQNSWAGGYDYWIIKFCDTTSTVGINSPNNPPSVSIYPNPFSDELNISVLNNQPTEIILYDMLSRKLLQREFTNSVSLSTSQLASGIYICEVRDKYEVIKKVKVVKE